MRLFVAAHVPDDALDRLAALPRPDVPGLRWTTRDQWHVTLRFLGAVPDDVVDDVVGSLTGLEVPAADVALGPAVDRFGRRILHVPVTGLEAVAAEVVGRTAGFGEPPEDRPFRGHVTLARARDRRGVDLRPLCGGPVAASWPVSSVALVESRLGRGGARYRDVATFPLA